ncbi:thioredoxin family protein [Psychrobacillus sp. FSL K6-2684]|uniref:Thioredoxin family protein n=1 Tax=Psychrobacillus faecigallinarum TaxID=2762235 RepID=A0ABR8R6V9_9BACI|nr:MULTISPECIES: thioredoxin family protein [Psychrobacillus]MBD7943480.1 thioredoxin family protein [Psychrobacillus faecigallinarum]QEY22641.1 thioredoxin [Psychrobacillus sp. AK 1817]QGM29512.1 thiol reductase thioredoxin [Bacillus sp. N3536]
MENLQSIDQFEQLKNTGKVVFKFTADWCPDCHFIDPFMGEVEEQFSEFQFISVDRDKFIDLCVELNILGIPSFVAFENGNEIGRFVSKDRKTREEIELFLQSI